MVTWFGQSWDASVCPPDTHVDTPVGQLCGWCDEAIGDNDSGVVLPVAFAVVPHNVCYHRNCWLRQVIGSVGHQDGRCSCRDGHGDGDPSNMTRRQAADAAVEMFYGKHRDE